MSSSVFSASTPVRSYEKEDGTEQAVLVYASILEKFQSRRHNYDRSLLPRRQTRWHRNARKVSWNR